MFQFGSSEFWQVVFHLGSAYAFCYSLEGKRLGVKQVTPAYENILTTVVGQWPYTAQKGLQELYICSLTKQIYKKHIDEK